jgi:hypothetical protein
VSRLEGNVLRTAAAYSRVPLRQLEEWDYLVDDYPQTRMVLEARVARAITLADERVDAAEAYVLRQLGMEAVLMLPVLVDDQAWGLVEIYAAVTRRFGPVEDSVAELLVATPRRCSRSSSTQTPRSASTARRSPRSRTPWRRRTFWTSDHTKEVARLAVAVGRRLELGDPGLRSSSSGRFCTTSARSRSPSRSSASRASSPTRTGRS